MLNMRVKWRKKIMKKIRIINFMITKYQNICSVREMFPLKEGGFIADLPGIKTLGLWDIQPEELDGYFPEIRPLVSRCFYSDCTHDESEVDCAVREAVAAGKIDSGRYESYLRMRFGDPEI